MIQTTRLRLRPFCEADREPFAAINGDTQVNAWLGGAIDRAASDATLDRISAHIREHGFGFWAAERNADGRLVGMIGLRWAPPELPLGRVLELGWRLAPDCWGQGLASEGARAALDWGFRELSATEIFAVTAASNHRSRAVMERIGMAERPEHAFDHPLLAVDHPLRRHVVFATRPSVQIKRA
jgi:RimJ/RimL family protein N-acetyltransferase